MKKYFSIVVSFLLGAVTFAQTPTVSNVMFSQRTDGTHIVEVYYDVNISGGGAMTVTMEASDDSGVTWNFPCVQITGDVGSGITSGTNKHIVWNFGAEHPNKFEDQMQIKIIATEEGIVMNVPCPGIPTVTYEGKTYNTVLIGTQCWLKENLDIGVMIQGIQNQTNNSIIEKYCYNNDPNNCNTYGGLYQWNETMQYSTTPGARGICPPGWHIPSQNDFQDLAEIVNWNGYALVAIGQGGGGGTNISGFSALMGGLRWMNGEFGWVEGDGYFWSSSETSTDYASYMILYCCLIQIDFDNYYKTIGKSVRCLKD